MKSLFNSRILKVILFILLTVLITSSLAWSTTPAAAPSHLDETQQPGSSTGEPTSLSEQLSGSPTPSVSPSIAAQTAVPTVPAAPTVEPPPAMTKIPEKEGLELILNESFDSPTLNTEIWNPQLYWGKYNPPELQTYLPEALEINDGILRMTAQKSDAEEPQYTSGIIASYDRLNFQYGHVEVRARPPKGQGLWSALWMLSNNHGSPAEIDLMEYLGHEPDIMHTTLHYDIGNGEREAQGSSTAGPDYSEDFHLFAVDWTWERVIWYIDGEEVFRMTDHVPQEPLYLLANLAVGGEWPGNPDESTVFPAYFDIDYIRVWRQSAPSVNLLENSSFENGSIFPWNERNDLSAGISQDTTTSATQSGTSLKVSLSSSDSQQPWLVSILQDNLAIEAQESYSLVFWAKAATPRIIRIVVQDRDPPYTEYTHQTVQLSSQWVRYAYTFAASEHSSNVMLNFNLADSVGDVWLDEVIFGQVKGD